MKLASIISIALLLQSVPLAGQDSIPALPDEFPIDSIAAPLPRTFTPVDTSAVTPIDTSLRINYWNITPYTGVIIPAIPDTFLTDYFNRTNPDGVGMSVAYLGNLGLPMESRVFFERPDRTEFMFFDHFWAYKKTPEKFLFTNTKIPNTNLSYQSAGSSNSKEERFRVFMTMNFGKELNAGVDIDYLYSRGAYNSQSAKHIDWTFFTNYLSDRHQLHVFVNPSSYTNAENGGLTDERWISNPDQMDNRNTTTKNFPTALSNTWNYINGQRYYLNYRYNLGFTRESDSLFVPVSSLIYTFDFENRKHRFFSRDSANLNNLYNGAYQLNPLWENDLPNDSTQWRQIRNVAGIALREGFSKWAKFDLTAYVRSDIRQFRLMTNDTLNRYSRENFSSTYLCGELAKRTGKILTYNAEGSFGLLGYNLGDVNASGKIETRIPMFGDTAAIAAKGYFKNLSPTFYENHYHSRYLSWNHDFSNIVKIFAGGELTLPQTRTKIGVGVENMTNYIYFANSGYPAQYSGNIQIVAATVEQNFKFGPFHWDTQAAFQTTSNDEILPLPAWCLYSSLFANFKIVKVLTIQAGINAHIWAKYYSPTYEPVIQQFKLQNQIKTGEYPLLCGFLNCHLKQTRFFVEYYNLGPMILGNNPNYFSMPFYPINPPVIKIGLSVDFIN